MLPQIRRSSRFQYNLTLAQSISLQGYPEEAREILNNIIAVVEEEDPALLATVLLHRAGTVLQLPAEETSRQDLETALADLSRSVDLQIELRGDRSDLTSRHRRALACCQQRCGDLVAAEQTARSALMAIPTVTRDHHPLCARSYARLASILLLSGQTKEANKLIEEASLTSGSGELSVEYQFSSMEARLRIDALAGRKDEVLQLLEELDQCGGERPAARQKRRKDLDQICSESGIESNYEE